MYYFIKSAYYHNSAIPGTTTGTSLSLTVTVHNLHSTVEETNDVNISSRYECLCYGNMAAVSARCMCTGSYAHIIIGP